MKSNTYAVLACNFVLESITEMGVRGDNVTDMIVDAIRENGQIAPAMYEQLAGWATSFGSKGGTDAYECACNMRIKLEAAVVFAGMRGGEVNKNILKAAKIFKRLAIDLKGFEKI
jgi:hypothetical protein